MRELRREIEIDAPPERVWAVVTDFAAYPEWNPFIRRISGALPEGAKLEVRIEPPGTRGTTFKPTARAVEANRELRWLGRLLVPGIFDGEHSLRIEPLEGGRSRFVQSERFSGVLVGLVKGTLAKTEAGFEQMNAALKAGLSRRPPGTNSREAASGGSEQPEQRLLRSLVPLAAQAGEGGGGELQLVQPHLASFQCEPGEPAHGGRLELR